MELRDLDLNLLVVFHQLLLDRSVSAAADSLGLTQPALSNALKRLRSRLNDELFVRTREGMAPTPYALHLAEPVAQALATLRGALNHPAGFDPASSQRRFVVAMTDIGEIHFLPRLLETLLQRAPGVAVTTLRAHPGLNEQLANGEVDLAVGLLPGLQAGFYQRCLFHHRYVGLCRQGHPLTRGPVTAERYCAHGHVRVVAASTGHEAVETHLNRAGLRRDIRLQIPDFGALGHILQHSDLVATVPQRLASSCLQPFSLATVAVPVALPDIAINLFWHAKYHRDPANQWLRGLMAEVFAD